MIILLDTSTPDCKLTLVLESENVETIWHADRELANGLLSFLHDTLQSRGYDWNEIEGIGIFQGPGSFTGLRIGITVMNTIADSQKVPIVGKRGESWKDDAVNALLDKQNDKIVMPFYGSDAHITLPRK